MLQLTAQTVMQMATTHTGKIFQLIWHYAYRTHIPAYCSDPGGEDHRTYRACVSAHCWNCDENDHHTHRSHLAAYLTSCIQVTHSSLLLRPQRIRPSHIQGTCSSSLLKLWWKWHTGHILQLIWHHAYRSHSSLLLRPLGIRHTYTDTGHMFQLTAQTVMKMTNTYPPAYFTSCIQVTHSSLLLRPWEIRPLHIQGTCFSSLSIMHHIPQLTNPNMGKRPSHIQLYKSCDPAHCTSCTKVSHPSSTNAQTLGEVITHSGHMFQLTACHACGLHIPAHCWDPERKDHHTCRSQVPAHFTSCIQVTGHTIQIRALILTEKIITQAGHKFQLISLHAYRSYIPDHSSDPDRKHHHTCRSHVPLQLILH